MSCSLCHLPFLSSLFIFFMIAIVVIVTMFHDCSMHSEPTIFSLDSHCSLRDHCSEVAHFHTFNMYMFTVWWVDSVWSYFLFIMSVYTSHISLCIFTILSSGLWGTVLPVLVLSLCFLQALSLPCLSSLFLSVGSAIIVIVSMFPDLSLHPGPTIFLNSYCTPFAINTCSFEGIIVLD